MSRYIVSPPAADDLDDIWVYITRDDMDAADRFLHKLERQIEAIAHRPAMGHRRKDLAGGRPLLFWPVGNHMILNRVGADLIEIVAVSRSRDIRSLLERRGL